MYREFIVPDDQEILEAIGEWPEVEEDSEARLLVFRGEGGESIRFTYDALARSVRVQWKSGHGETLVDIFREGATRLTAHSDKSIAYIALEFVMGECAGKMEIQVRPKMAVKDHLLFS
jgi:YD repeat-containing protein